MSKKHTQKHGRGNITKEKLYKIQGGGARAPQRNKPGPAISLPSRSLPGSKKRR